MIQRIGDFSYRLAARWIPDPFIFALLLTLIAFLAGILFAPWEAGTAPWDAALRMAGYWQAGFWSLLEFGMQMCLVLVLGGTLARSRPVERLIDRLAELPGNGAGAAALVAFTACAAALLNWGLGLIVGALMARRVAAAGHRRGLSFHYPLLGAAGYTGLMVWHGGFSGSGPLALNTAGGAVVQVITGGELIPLSQTIFSPLNLAVSGALLVFVPWLCARLAPRGAEGIVPASPEVLMERSSTDEPPPKNPAPAERLETSRWPTLIAGLAGLAVLAWSFAGAGFGLGFLNLNTVNGLLLFLGLVLHRHARAYVAAIAASVGGAGGIVLQFPFYAGIMGMIGQSGLAGSIAAAVASAATPVTFPLFTFLSAGLINVFIPSGGGQVAIQGPIVHQVSTALGARFDIGFMALCYGDQWTNMLQPFWALPLLGVTGLRARDLLGYTVVIMLLSGLVIGGLLVLFSLF